MVHQNVHIPLTVIELIQVNAECKSLIFERPKNFNYEAGDWIDIDFADISLRGGKTYSLSSSPTERELAITFREGISPFKRQLQSVQPGDKLFISQYGNDYGFQLNEKQSSLLIAGGIGIAPFRSMIKEMHDTAATSDVRLIYLNKTDNFTFRSELDEWQQKMPYLLINYVVTENLKRKAREQLLTTLFADEADRYYIAGPDAMVENTEHQLLEMGVALKDIRIDNFGTY